YDLYHPTEIIGWHWGDRRATRPTLPWVCTDHLAQNGLVPWFERDRQSRLRVQALLRSPWEFDRFGCGPARTLAEYEAFAGVSFAHGCVSDHTRQGHEPPHPEPVAAWLPRISHYQFIVRLEKASLPFDASTVTDWKLVVPVYGADRQLIDRVDLRHEL